jgi:hypothetical protein
MAQGSNRPETPSLTCVSSRIVILRSQDKDGLRPIERGQAWFDILLGHDTPAARAILSAQPSSDIRQLNTELSDPRWQTIISDYHQLPLPAQEPKAVGWY